MRLESRGFEADRSDQGVEIVDDALVEAVELRSPLGFEPSIRLDGAEEACREWGIDAFEELQEDEADRVSLREQLITARVGDFGNKSLGAEFREIVVSTPEQKCIGWPAQKCVTGLRQRRRSLAARMADCSVAPSGQAP